MKTKEEVMEMIKKNAGFSAYVYRCEHGCNGEYSIQEFDDILKEDTKWGYHNPWCLLDEEWELQRFEPVTNEDVYVYHWEQEDDYEGCIEGLKEAIDAGEFYCAEFYKFYDGTYDKQEILVRVDNI